MREIRLFIAGFLIAASQHLDGKWPRGLILVIGLALLLWQVDL